MPINIIAIAIIPAIALDTINSRIHSQIFTFYTPMAIHIKIVTANVNADIIMNKIPNNISNLVIFFLLSTLQLPTLMLARKSYVIL